MSGHISSDHSRSASRSSQTPRLSQGQYESMPRHSFGRTSRVSNPNVFSDEYSLEPIDVDQIQRAPSPASISSSATLTQPTHKPAGATPTEHVDPFADEARASFEEPHRSSLPQKGAFADNRNSVSSINNPSFAMQRNQSVSSRFSIPRALSPYTGTTGPSHPYSMYPQIGVSRTSSVASASTIRQQHDRPLGETSGPQHPYGMYAQNVVEEGMDDDIPLGFPGLNTQYQPPTSRRIDDVGDIIGPDGHAEPLPPYSRYPTGVVPKPPGMETMAADGTTPVDIHLSQDETLHSTSREQPISSTSSRDLISNDSERNQRNAGLAAAGAAGGAAGATGIMAFEEKLKQKGKKTVCCGLPIWTIVLVTTVMLIGGSIGGAIGGVLGTRKAQEEEKNAHHTPKIVTVTASAQMDYSSITTTPSGYTTAPTGHFTMDAVLQKYSRMCVEDHDIKEVWSCLEQPKDFEIFVGGEELTHQSISFANTPPATTTYSYGAQQPVLPTPTQNLSLVLDTSAASMGPALFFWTYYDKLVVLPEDSMGSSSSSKRDLSVDGDFASYIQRKQTAQPGDKPWFCWWNQTVLEFFLYVNESSTDSSYSASATTGGNLAASMATAQAQKRDDAIYNYPRVIKMEERRDHGGAMSPYCQQMTVDPHGELLTIPSRTIPVAEIEPTPTTTVSNTANGADQTYTAKAEWATPCYCLSVSD